MPSRSSRYGRCGHRVTGKAPGVVVDRLGCGVKGREERAARAPWRLQSGVRAARGRSLEGAGGPGAAKRESSGEHRRTGRARRLRASDNDGADPAGRFLPRFVRPAGSARGPLYAWVTACRSGTACRLRRSSLRSSQSRAARWAPLMTIWSVSRWMKNCRGAALPDSIISATQKAVS